MKKRIFDEQNISILSEAEAGGGGPEALTQACYFRRHLLNLAQEVRRYRSSRSDAAQVT